MFLKFIEGYTLCLGTKSNSGKSIQENTINLTTFWWYQLSVPRIEITQNSLENTLFFGRYLNIIFTATCRNSNMNTLMISFKTIIEKEVKLQLHMYNRKLSHKMKVVRVKNKSSMLS